MNLQMSPTVRRRLSAALIIIGVSIGIFPFLQQAWGSYNQWQLDREWNAAVDHAGKTGTVPREQFGRAPERWLAVVSGFFAMRVAEAAPAHPPDLKPHRQSISKDPLLQHNRRVAARPMGLTRIEIPRIGLRAYVVDGTSDWQLAKGPAHFIGTALPGEPGNCAIAAHRNVYGSWFKDLNLLRAGDTILLQTPKSSYTYKVTLSKIVDSDNTAVLNPTRGATLTLVTCMIPYARHRLIVWGKKV